MRLVAALLVLAALPAGAAAAPLEKRLTRSWVIFSGAVEGSVPRHPEPGRARRLGRGPVGVTTTGDPIGRAPVHAGARLLGYLRDGFRLYSVKGEPKLDRCHGRFLRIRGRRAYQYVATPGSPFVAKCFRAPPRRFTFPSAPQPEATPVPQPEETTTPVPTAAPVHVEGVWPPLEPGYTDHVTRACDRPGESFDVTVGAAVHHVRCLPADFPEWELTRRAPGAADVYLLAPALQTATPYLVATDRHLTPVWWQRTETAANDLRDLPGGALTWWEDDAYHEQLPDGTPLRTWRTAGVLTDNHDIAHLPNGNVLLLGYPVREHVDLSAYGHGDDETVFDGAIQEIAPDGSVAWSWSSVGHIGLDEPGRWWANPILTLPNGLTANDIVHLNSVEPVPGGLIVSARHTDAVYKLDRATGEIVWKLGGTPTARSLAFDGDLGGQHDARVLPDGTLTLFDNRTRLANAVPRALRLAIDETAMTATVLEDVRDPEIESSRCCGSARRLEDGSWLVSWGGLDGWVSEIDPGGEVAWRLHTRPGFTYRTVPARHLAVADLRAAMDVSASAGE